MEVVFGNSGYFIRKEGGILILGWQEDSSGIDTILKYDINTGIFDTAIFPLMSDGPTFVNERKTKSMCDFSNIAEWKLRVFLQNIHKLARRLWKEESLESPERLARYPEGKLLTLVVALTDMLGTQDFSAIHQSLINIDKFLSLGFSINFYSFIDEMGGRTNLNLFAKFSESKWNFAFLPPFREFFNEKSDGVISDLSYFSAFLETRKYSNTKHYNYESISSYRRLLIKKDGEKYYSEEQTEILSNNIFHRGMYDFPEEDFLIREIMAFLQKLNKPLPKRIEPTLFYLQLRREHEESQNSVINKGLLDNHLKYSELFECELEKSELVVVMPKTKEEVEKEAKQQRNCLVGYLPRMATSPAPISIVLFFRKKSNPSESYITAEFSVAQEKLSLRQFNTKRNNEVEGRLADSILKEYSDSFVKKDSLFKNFVANYETAYLKDNEEGRLEF